MTQTEVGEQVARRREEECKDFGVVESGQVSAIRIEIVADPRAYVLLRNVPVAPPSILWTHVRIVSHPQKPDQVSKPGNYVYERTIRNGYVNTSCKAHQ